MGKAKTLVIKHIVDATDASDASVFLVARSGLSKSKVKDAMNKGAVWFGKATGTMKRLRRATAQLRVGDRIELHYNEELLARAVPGCVLVSDEKHYSVWDKASGVLAQGTFEGDHCSLLRQVELHYKATRPVFLVHRLDREATGLMIVAHSQNAAARLSAMFQNNQVDKRYRVTVRGQLAQSRGLIDLPLDGKDARTEYDVETYDTERDESVVNVTITTGRLHQIRRHFAAVDHAVIGDPKYGTGNKNQQGMQLRAVQLSFRCPFSRVEKVFRV